MTEKFDADVIIAGAGLTGNTLAGLLADRGIQCLILDEFTPKQTAQRPDPRTLAITRASENILRATGAWNQLSADSLSVFNKMQVWDETSSGRIEFDSAEICQPNMGYIIEQKILERATNVANQQKSLIKTIHAVYPEQINSNNGNVELLLSDDSKISGRLLVGADGSRSRVRKLANIDYPIHDYHQTALACRVKTAVTHDKTARQRFLQTGPLAFLPLNDPHYCGIVWSTSPAQAQELVSIPEEEFMQRLGMAFEHVLGDIMKVEFRTTFPLQHAQAEQYCLPGLVLIGDAAHTVHPLAGQGANMGLLDAATLAEVLCKDPDDKCLLKYSALRRYERWRKGENLMMLKTMQILKELFASRMESVCYLRSTGMKILDYIHPLKNRLMRHAMGLSGDLPLVARQLL